MVNLAESRIASNTEICRISRGLGVIARPRRETAVLIVGDLANANGAYDSGYTVPL
jgi:hypothetical protein